jgi:hypothetical protein
VKPNSLKSSVEVSENLVCEHESRCLVSDRDDRVYSLSMPKTLPEELTHGADLKHGEYAWSIDSFPDALTLAPGLGFACLGGQFQLRPDSDTSYELFWGEANSSERLPSEGWKFYAARSCSEVSERFTALLETVDFRQEALKFESLDDWLTPGKPLTEFLVFNAYFVDESEYELLRRGGIRI